MVALNFNRSIGKTFYNPLRHLVREAGIEKLGIVLCLSATDLLRLGFDEPTVFEIIRHLGEVHGHRLRHEDQTLGERAIEVYGLFDSVPLEVLLFTGSMTPDDFLQLQAQGITTWGAFGRLTQQE